MKENENKYVYDYYYPEEIVKEAYIRVPKILMVENRFKKLSIQSKLLFGLIQDRASLSNLNNWKDEFGRIYLYFSIEDIQEALNVGKGTAIKFMKELEDFGLIEKKKQGQGKPNIIFVKNPNSYKIESGKNQKFKNQTSEKNEVNFSKNVIENTDEICNIEKVDNSTTNNKVLDLNFKEFQNETLINEKSKLLEVQNLNFKKSKNQTSRSPKFELLEVQKVNPNNTNINNTEYNNTDINKSIYQSNNLNNEINLTINTKDKIDWIDLSSKSNQDLIVLVKDQIKYDHIKTLANQSMLDMIVDLLVTIYSKNKGYEKVSGQKVSVLDLKERFNKLESDDIVYVIESLENVSNITNYRNYLITTLYNCRSSVNLYYADKVNSDFKENIEKSNEIINYDWLDN